MNSAGGREQWRGRFDNNDPTMLKTDANIHNVAMQWGIKIPLRDGIRLNATLYLPREHPKPTPSIFTLTPYIAQNYHDMGVYFASHGYPFLTVDVRGRGNSGGEFIPYLNEGRDGYDVVEWLAQQPYCSAQVTMWGGSYAGLNQWNTARERPPHLATIVPAASPYMGVDFPLRSNIASPYIMQLLTLVSGRASQDKIFTDGCFWGAQFRRWFESGAAFKELDTLLGNPSEVFQEWLAHPHLDAYWDRYSPTTEQYARLALPILTITGSYDGDQPGALRHYREHLRYAPETARAQHHLIIGPWDHAGTRSPQAEFSGIKVGPASLVDLPRLHLEWYAWTMREGPKPTFLRKNVAYYVMGSEVWRYADSLEGITARSEALYLHSEGNPTDVFHSGFLSGDAPRGSNTLDTYVYNPRDTRHAALESTVDPEDVTDQRMIHLKVGQQLIYHSAPFESDTQISGFFKLSVWFAIDQPDTDFAARVYEIDLEGRSILLSSDWIRARHRGSSREEQIISTLEPLRYDFEGFMFVSRRVRQGNRLRLVIGPINSIYAQKNYNSGGVVSEESMGDARPVTVRLLHDVAHPSVLCVPIGHPET